MEENLGGLKLDVKVVKYTVLILNTETIIK